MAIVAKKLVMEKDRISGYLAYPQRKERGPAILWIHHNQGVTHNLNLARELEAGRSTRP